MTTSRGSNQIKRRVKTGCLNCRKRHKKCDESKPRCGLCIKRKTDCIWPSYDSRFIDKSHSEEARDSRSLKSERVTFDTQLSEFSCTDPATKSMPHTSKAKPLPHSVAEAYEIIEAEQLAEDTCSPPEQEFDPQLSQITPCLPNPGPLVQDDKKTYTDRSKFCNRNDLQSLYSRCAFESFTKFPQINFTYRDYVFTNISVCAINDEVREETYGNPLVFHTNYGRPTEHGQLPRNLSSNRDTEIAMANYDKILNCVTEEEKFDLFKTYLFDIARWLDVFDSDRQFGITIPQLAQSDRALMSSIYAIASKTKAKSTHQADITRRFSDTSLQCLYSSVSRRPSLANLATCVNLCLIEMMSSSPRKWRNSLEGCSALLISQGINGFSGSIQEAFFWLHARLDVLAAVISEEATLIPPKQWSPYIDTNHGTKELFVKSNYTAYDYANYVVYLCARIMYLITQTYNDYSREWECLWHDLSDWYSERPAMFKTISSIDRNPFPYILYVNDSISSAMQFFHMGAILLMQNKPRLHKMQEGPIKTSLIWHAKQICAIAANNSECVNFISALQPLWLARDLLSSSEEQEYIMNILKKTENQTGWSRLTKG
ncbi:Piso0_000582 [Millerozyma farinosa CBS 7064]|uniref:Piso0_000582 protein n=1 Tax=Pichia sorbitophila (strain ATCC MYA-4447 / BCRC 22081 / CBS 7064 / NBRC 10061 / NRRL Y-12695) TaxID=559304 RepID=G8YSS3_PICSO|nr:Piso0_000582 [Millerozyma farinosa CBS 7064]CCE73535.1 Piso0_000582 [Millerozyma farinosa CBS 7064]